MTRGACACTFAVGRQRGGGPVFPKCCAFRLLLLCLCVPNLAASACGRAACVQHAMTNQSHSLYLLKQPVSFLASCPAALGMGLLAAATSGRAGCRLQIVLVPVALPTGSSGVHWLVDAATAGKHECLPAAGSASVPAASTLERACGLTRETAGEDCHGAFPAWFAVMCAGPPLLL